MCKLDCRASHNTNTKYIFGRETPPKKKKKKMKTSSLVVVLLGTILPAALRACTVTRNGEDRTDDYWVLDTVTGEEYVDCRGKSKCRDAIITDCPAVKCGDIEACLDARILNFTETVSCEGKHACHRTEMLAAAAVVGEEEDGDDDEDDDDKKPPMSVSCLGTGACDYARISGTSIAQVSCSGDKACRKIRIEGAKVVKCHHGSDIYPACQGLSTFDTECLYCGKNGCLGKMNGCKYRIIGEGTNSKFQKFKTCPAETVVGDGCSDELRAELRFELSGEAQQLDAGTETGTR